MNTGFSILKCGKNSFFLMLVLVLVFLISGCTGPAGADGEDGKAFFKLTNADNTLWSYSHNNGSVPSRIQLNQDYDSSPGTYSFDYECRYYVDPVSYYYIIWSGTYRIWVHEGEKGEDGGWFWQSGDDGENGENSYLSLYCEWEGSTETRVNKMAPGVPEVINRNPSYRQKSGKFRMEVEYYLVDQGYRHGQPAPNQKEDN